MADAIQRRFYARPLRFEPLESRRVLSITVDTLVDENNGAGVGAGTSLREAIAAAAAGDTIDFSVTGTISLLVGTSNSAKQLTINKNLTISGPGANLLTIKAFDPTPATKNGDGSRVFTIDDGSTATVRDVSISGLTLTGGDANTAGGAISSAENLVVTGCVINGNTTTASLDAGGGGIFSKATRTRPNSLTIRDSTLSGNTAPNWEGGAVRQRYGQLAIENCTISNNSALFSGGGVAAQDGVNVQISGSIFSTNNVPGVPSQSYPGTGGAIFGLGSTISISSSTISGNTATTGGGVYAENHSTVIISSSVLSTNTVSAAGGGVATGNSTLSVVNSTLSGNSATGSGGGGIGAFSSTLTVKNSTISGNSARIGGGIEAYAKYSGSALIESSTITGNTASDDMGAIYSVGNTTIRFSTIAGNTTPTGRNGAVASWGKATGTITVQSSIIAGNTNGDVGYKNNPSPFASLGYNLIGTGINSSLASFNQAGDQTGVLNPMLGALADNGGPMKTRMPLPGSPAIDAGNPAAVAGMGGVPLYDQRGNPLTRVWDGDGAGGVRIDIGAVESQSLPLPPAVFGDYEASGAVGSAGFVLWRKTVGASLTAYSGADGSGNGVVGAEDYDVWRAHFSETYAAGSGASVEGRGASLGAIAVGRETSSDVVAVYAAGVDGRSRGPAGRASNGTRIRTLAEPVAAEVWRDDALVAWAGSKGRVREGAAVEIDVTGSDSIEKFGDESCDAFYASVGELMGTALV